MGTEKQTVGEVFIKVTLDDSEALEKICNLENRLQSLSSAFEHLTDFEDLPA